MKNKGAVGRVPTGLGGVNGVKLDQFCQRVQGRYRRYLSGRLCRREVAMRNIVPLVSFTFDDFPRSAFRTGGEILEAHGFRGTYYAALGLMNQHSPVGKIFSGEDLEAVQARGHELGCHTFGHCHAWDTAPGAFEDSVLENRRALARVLPQVFLGTLSYPMSCPRPGTKRRMSKHFECCRSGGQTFNSDRTDLNGLRGFFIEQSRDNRGAIEGLIDRTCEAGGWLILATHDVCEQPTRYGCTPELFDQIVRYAAHSGATVLPVGKACQVMLGRPRVSPAHARIAEVC